MRWGRADGDGNDGLGSVRVGYRALNKLNVPLEFGVRGADRLVRHPPHRVERSRVIRQAWNDVPVDVRKLVAQEFVVDFLGAIDLRERLGDGVHGFHQLNSFRRRQMEEFRCMALQDDDGPTAEKLIVVEIDFCESDMRNEMIGSWPGSCAGFARRVAHVRMFEERRLILCPSTA